MSNAFEIMLTWQQHMNFAQFFTQRHSESNNNGNQLVQTEFNMGTPRLDNRCQYFSS